MAYGARDFLVSQANPAESEAAMRRQLYTCMGTAVAPVAAVPTTASHLSLWNGELAGGKSYIIHAVGTMCGVSAAAAIILGVLIHMGTSAEASPAGAAVIKGTSGQTYQGLGNGKVSASVVNSGSWHMAAEPVQTANTATIGFGTLQDVWGRYIVPPGFIFSVASFCSAAGSATCIPQIIFSEAQITLG